MPVKESGQNKANGNENFFKAKLALGCLLFLFLVFGGITVSHGQNFIGPQSSAGIGQGAIGVDSTYNLSVGTTTTQADTKLLIVGTSTTGTAGSTYFAIKVLDVNRGPLFIVRGDGSVSIGTPYLQISQTGTTSTIPSVNTTAPPNGALFVNGPIMGSLDLKALGGIAVGTTTPQSGGNVLVTGAVSVGTTTNSGGGLYVGSGGITTNGVINSSNFVGLINAANVTAGAFPTGNFAHQSSLGVGTSTTVGLPQVLSVQGGGYFSNSVGIGTTSPADKLQVYGGGAYIGDPNSKFWIGPSSGTNYIESGNGAWSASANLSICGYNCTAVGTLYFNSTNSYFTGNLGVGASPSQLFEVYGINPIAKITQNPGNPGGAGIWLTASGTDSSSNAAYVQFHGSKSIWAQTGSQNLYIGPTTRASANVIIDGSGNVGIGTAPSAGLHVVSPTATYTTVVDDTSAAGGGFWLRRSGSDTVRMLIDSVDFNMLTSASYGSSRDIKISSKDGNGNIKLMGLVGIATTTPTNALSVQGNANISGSLTAATLNGSYTGTITAPNVSAGLFPTGNFTFQSSLGVGTTTTATLPQTLTVQGGGYFAGNVGIGQNSPAYLLDVGTTAGTVNIRGSSGQLYVNNIAPNTGSNINISANVGIGTTPTQKLEVAGTIFLTGNPGSNRYVAIDETNTGTTQLIFQAGAGSAGYGGGLSLYGHSHASFPGWVKAGISSGSGGKFAVNTWGTGGGTDVMTVDASGNTYIAGNVGIGVASPQGTLDLGATGLLTFGASYKWGMNSNVVSFDRGGSYPSGYNLNTAAASGLFVNSSGNVGIGTTSPGNKLSINGTNGSSNDFAGYPGWSTGVVPNGAEIQLNVNRPFTYSVNGSTYRGGLSIGNGGGVGIYSVNPNPGGSQYYGDIRFYTTYWNTDHYENADRMIISQTGLIGIGTTAPTNRLSVSGNADISGTLTATTLAGTYTGTISAANVSAATFGSNTGNGNFTFPANLTVNANFTTHNGTLTLFNDYIYVSAVNQNTLNSGYGTNATADMWLNYRGYNDGQTQWRNLNVGDGRGSNVAWFDGANHRMSIGNGQVANYTLDVNGTMNVSGAWTMGGAAQTALNMNANNISGVNKITVTTVDPVYDIAGVKYATYGASIAGGVKEEYTGRGMLARNDAGDYEYVLNLSKAEKGSDVWLWYNAIDFSKDNVEAVATPYGRSANIYYVIESGKIIFRADASSVSGNPQYVEFSFRLTGNRFDWKEWPTLSKDQNERASLVVKEPR